MRTTYRKGEDLNGASAIHHSILSVDPRRMLSYRTIKSPSDFPFADALAATWVVIYFEAVDARRTRVTARMLGFTADGQSQKTRAFFESGNKATIDRLLKRFGG